VIDRIRVLIVDDHPLVADSLRRLLTSGTDCEVVGVARTGADALRLAREMKPSVILMDYHLPDESGAATTAKIHADNPQQVVVFLSSDDRDESLFAAVEAGAAGYLSKGADPATILPAIRRAAAGEMLVRGADLARLIATRRGAAVAAAEQARHRAAFSDREMEIMRMLADGEDTPQMAAGLFIEAGTVRWHIKNILTKLGVHSRIAAVAEAARQGVI